MPTPTPSHAGDPLLEALGGAIRSIRNEQSISQEVLAHDSGVERAYLSGIERGLQNLSVMTLARLARGLNVSLSTIVQKAKI